MIEYLTALDTAGIPYVSWKNNHELPLALAGKSDLDIFVPERFGNQALELASKAGWKRLENPVATYPQVTHLYRLGEDLEVYHLHLYFRVVTGESWLKEYRLPFDEMLQSERRLLDDSGVWGLNDRAQAYLFAVRHLLKGGSFFSRLLYRRELASYRDEWRRCAVRVEDLSDWGPLPLDRCVDGSGLGAGGFALPEIATAVRFRNTAAPYLRFPGWSLPPRRVFSLLHRAANKLLFRRNKLIPGGGLVVAISGIDGCGKSTMLNEASRVFTGFLTVRRVALGKPQGALLEAVRKLLKRGKSRPDGKADTTVAETGARSPRVLSSVSAVVLALLRLGTARRAVRLAARGYLVLADRWPTDVHGMMDGPRLAADGRGSSIVTVCKRIEHWAYRRMPAADVCFFLQAPESVLIDRNRNRVKAAKETDAGIRDRSRQNQQFKPLARKTVYFDNNGPLESKRKELLLLIWKEIAAA